MRMVLEVVMLFALVGGLFFAMRVLAEENRQDKALAKNDQAGSAEGELKPGEPELEE